MLRRIESSRMQRRDARTTVREGAAARRPRGSRTPPRTAAHGARPVSSIDTASARRPLKPDASLDPQGRQAGAASGQRKGAC
ncbi:hypothetical protein BUPH_06816 [Paraburkholderia phenoliruptrix BR3459a]|uniref:Uncharacterized protein n=1 Tax=Paraburkholderia phenoliruptrix BR3459a TaxID=1229205 RepID=K0DM96_9BURK|nr:hypothetical protein BUPH_06816 [Paraburkholderia phenoliruptrix BR3459a]